MNVIEYAKRELDLVGMPENSQEPINLAMRNYILGAVEHFSQQNFSGFAAGNAIAILSRILQLQPLTPLTGEDWEWMQVEEDLYQNIRYPSVFKNSESAWDIHGKVFVDTDGGTFTSSESRVFISFPYSPNQEYVKVDYSLKGLSILVSADGKECASCRSASLTPFSDESVVISLQGEQTSVAGLSGWHCSDCDAKTFDMESAQKYSSYVTEFASHISSFKKESAQTVNE